MPGSRHWLNRKLLLATSGAALLAWGVFSIAPRARLDPRHPELHMTDFTVFTTASTALLAGKDPYDTASPRGWPYLYPPFFALLVAPLRNQPTHIQALCWFVLNATLLFACLYEARQLGLILWTRTAACGTDHDEPHAASAREPPGRIGILAFLAALLPALDCLQTGQTGHAILYPLLAGLRLLLTAPSWQRRMLAGMLLAVPIGIKVTPALPVALLFAARTVCGSRRHSLQPLAGLVAASAACWLLLPSAAIGWQANCRLLARWYQQIRRAADVTSQTGINLLSPRNQSMYIACYRLTHGWPVRYSRPATFPTDSTPSADAPPPPTRSSQHAAVDSWHKLAAACCTALLLFVAATTLHLARGCQPASSSAAFGLGCSASLLVAPISWGHHFVLLLPASMLVCLLLHRLSRPRLALGLGTSLLPLTVLHYAALDVAGRYALLAFGLTLWLIVACVALWHAAGRPHRMPGP
jgi:hypothetical protein